MKWKVFGLIGVISLGYLMRPMVQANEDEVENKGIHKSIQATMDLPLMPEGYEYIDWHKRATSFNEVLFDTENHHYTFFEPGLYHSEETKLGMMTLVEGNPVMSESEAITVITALLSAQSLGEEIMDPETLHHMAKKVEAYYQADHGENTFLNYQGINSRDLTFWQQVYPALLYFMLMDDIEPTENSDKLLLQIADSWHEVIMELGGEFREVDFAYTGYDFKKKEPFDNGKWVEIDGAAGAALIQYYAFLKFGDRKYMDATTLCMDYLDSLKDHPGHHILYFYLPYLSARLNSQEGTTYNTAKFIEYFFTETTYQNKWGWFDNLVGDLVEYGGVTYSYESLMASLALVPMLKYDQRYAVEVGRYLLHLSQDLDIFFNEGEVFPLNKSQNGSPSILGGTPLGLFASTISPTNVEGILRVDLNTNEYYDKRQRNHQSFLFFNPHDKEETIQYQVKSNQMVSLYDLVTQDFVALNVQNEIDLNIPAEGAVIILEIEIEDGDGQYEINRKVEKDVLADIKAGVNIVNFKPNMILEDDIEIELDIMLKETSITSITMWMDQDEFFQNVTYDYPYMLDISELSEGYHILEVELKAGPEKDYAYAQFYVNKGDSKHILASDVDPLLEWGVDDSTLTLDFSQIPILELDIADFNSPWSLYLRDEKSQERFILRENCEDKGVIKFDINEEVKRLNKGEVNLVGTREISFEFSLVEPNSHLWLNQMKWFYKGIVPLNEKEWKTAFTSEKMAQWESRLGEIGKLNYYQGHAWIKNLNEGPSGVGGIETPYFEVDLSKDLWLEIEIEEVDELWSLLVYVEGEQGGHYLQYPTHETGKFTYKVSQMLEAFYHSDDSEELKNIQFWLVSNGDYESITKLDYLKLGYSRSWIHLTIALVIGLIGIKAIFVNINNKS